MATNIEKKKIQCQSRILTYHLLYMPNSLYQYIKRETILSKVEKIFRVTKHIKNTTEIYIFIYFHNIHYWLFI